MSEIEIPPYGSGENFLVIGPFLPSLPTVQIGILHRRSILQPVQKCRQLRCPTLEMASDFLFYRSLGVLDYDANDVRGHTSRAKDRPRIFVVGQIGR